MLTLTRENKPLSFALKEEKWYYLPCENAQNIMGKRKIILSANSLINPSRNKASHVSLLGFMTTFGESTE